MRALLLILCVGVNISLFAQKVLSAADIDQLSYEEFQQRKFNELKLTVEDAGSNGIDFYYLRLRAGILAYDKKKYEYAIPQFKKALEFFPADTLSKEYLYYAYLFSDRKEMANDFASNQDKDFQQKVGYKKKPFDFIGIDGGAMITNNIPSNRNNSFKSGTNPGKAERILNGNLYFGDVFFQNTIKNRLHIYNSFSVFSTSSLYQIEVVTPTKPNFRAEKEFVNLNYQYNLGLSYVTKKEWLIALGFGYYRVKGNSFTALEPDVLNNRIPIAQDTTKINSFLGSVTVSKRFKYVKPYLQLSLSNLNALTQIQAGGGLTYYPLGNFNFYGTTSATYLKNGNVIQYIIGQQIGFKITHWWWSEINFNYGNLSNFITNNGVITYNTSDAIKLQTGLDFNFYIKKHFQMGIGYTLQQRERTTKQFATLGISNGNEISNYFNHLIKTILLWNF